MSAGFPAPVMLRWPSIPWSGTLSILQSEASGAVLWPVLGLLAGLLLGGLRAWISGAVTSRSSP